MPHADGQDALRAELTRIVRASPWFMAALQAVRALQLADGCIGAGAVRNLVWDHLHGHDEPSPPADVDVAYFDDTAHDPQRDAQLQARLRAVMPAVPWEVTNQAWVHTWFEAVFGHPVPPLRSLPEAVATWPEYATAVAVRLEADDRMTVIAPHGLDDLFALRVRRNPVRVSLETYRERVRQKAYTARWPRVTVEPA